jgi:hypothetical protein
VTEYATSKHQTPSHFDVFANTFLVPIYRADSEFMAGAVCSQGLWILERHVVVESSDSVLEIVEPARGPEF